MVYLFFAIFCLLKHSYTQLSYPTHDNCVTANKINGTCMPLSNCKQIKNRIDVLGIESVQNYLLQANCGFEGSEPKICCLPEITVDTTTEPVTIPDIYTTSSTTTETSSRSKITTENPNSVDDFQLPDVSEHPNLRFLPNSFCGAIYQDDFRIVGGNETKVSEYPWMSLISYKIDGGGTDFRCGGTVINKRYVLTAAHCVFNLPSNMKLHGVRLGEHDTSKNRDCDLDEFGNEIACAEDYEDIEVERVHIHSKYNRLELHNDIALIRLSREVNFSEKNNIKPVCLPVKESASFDKIKKKKMVVTGWGTTESGIASTVLLQVKLDRFDQENCTKVFAKQTKIWEKQICYGGKAGKDSCSGDSGGPLQTAALFGNQMKMVQYGIVSFGISNCGVAGYPGVYTRVDYYLDWILDNIEP